MRFTKREYVIICVTHYHKGFTFFGAPFLPRSFSLPFEWRRRGQKRSFVFGAHRGTAVAVAVVDVLSVSSTNAATPTPGKPLTRPARPQGSGGGQSISVAVVFRSNESFSSCEIECQRFSHVGGIPTFSRFRFSPYCLVPKLKEHACRRVVEEKVTRARALSGAIRRHLRESSSKQSFKVGKLDGGREGGEGRGRGGRD